MSRIERKNNYFVTVVLKETDNPSSIQVFPVLDMGKNLSHKQNIDLGK